MKENETLKYHESKQFNSENLKQYDTEGQKYFLGYLLRKGYDFNIKNGEIEFKDITSENKVKEVIEKYNNESMIENLNIKKAICKSNQSNGNRRIQSNNRKKVKEFKKKRERIKRKIIYTKQVNLG